MEDQVSYEADTVHVFTRVPSGKRSRSW